MSWKENAYGDGKHLQFVETGNQLKVYWEPYDHIGWQLFDPISNVAVQRGLHGHEDTLWTPECGYMDYYYSYNWSVFDFEFNITSIYDIHFEW